MQGKENKILSNNLDFYFWKKKLDYQTFVISRELNKFSSVCMYLDLKSDNLEKIIKVNCQAYWQKIHTFLIYLKYYQQIFEIKNSKEFESSLTQIINLYLERLQVKIMLPD